MARKLDLQQISERLEVLEDEIRDLRQALTPHAELRLAVTRLRRQARIVPSRVLQRTLDRELREVRRERAARAR